MTLTDISTESIFYLPDVTSEERKNLQEALRIEQAKVPLPRTAKGDSNSIKALRSVIYQFMAALAADKEMIAFSEVQRRFFSTLYPESSPSSIPENTLTKLTAILARTWLVGINFLQRKLMLIRATRDTLPAVAAE